MLDCHVRGHEVRRQRLNQADTIRVCAYIYICSTVHIVCISTRNKEINKKLNVRLTVMSSPKIRVHTERVCETEIERESEHTRCVIECIY